MAETVVVALSGGVDSSVAALVLKEQGYQVVGMTLKTWDRQLCNTVPKGQTCCSTRDVEDARQVAFQLGIPFYVVEASEAFSSEVIDYFVKGYAQGFTPNPCVVCNRQIKCGKLLEQLQALGGRWLATGHYAQVAWDPAVGRYQLREAVDAGKDQSYVLHQLTQEQLAQMIFPLGNLSKSQVRERAWKAGLPVADKPESMELCFIPDGDTQAFLRRRAPEAFQAGEIVNQEGQVLGTHPGIASYTVGQRRGLGLASRKPLYVLRVEPQTRRVVVGEAKELEATSARVGDLRWVSIPSLEGPRRSGIKIRYQSAKAFGWLYPEGNQVRVEFDEPVAGGITPGQAAVFYDDAVVLGGGWIQKEFNPSPNG